MISKYQRIYLAYHVKEFLKKLPKLMKTASTTKESKGSISDFLGLTFLGVPFVVAILLGIISLVGALIFWPLPGIPTWSIGSFIWTTYCWLYFIIIIPFIVCYLQLDSEYKKETAKNNDNLSELRFTLTQKLAKKVLKLGKTKEKLEKDKVDFETLKTEFNTELTEHPKDEERINPGKKATENSCEFLDSDIEKITAEIIAVEEQKTALEATLESSFEETLKDIAHWKKMILIYKKLQKKGQKYPHVIASYKRDITESIIAIEKKIKEL